MAGRLVHFRRMLPDNRVRLLIASFPLPSQGIRFYTRTPKTSRLPRKLALGNGVPRVYTIACISAIQSTFSHARPYPQQTARAAHC